MTKRKQFDGWSVGQLAFYLERNGNLTRAELDEVDSEVRDIERDLLKLGTDLTKRLRALQWLKDVLRHRRDLNRPD